MRRVESGPMGPLVLLAGVIAVVVVLLGVASFGAYQLLSADRDAENPSSSSRPTSSPSAENTPQPQISQAWRDTARRFGVAFTTTQGGHRAWMRRLKPLVSPSLAQGYSYTDMSLVPTTRLTRVTGGAEVVGETPARSAQLHYANGLVVDVTVAQVPTTQKWVITTAVAHEESEGPAQPPVTEQEKTNA